MRQVAKRRLRPDPGAMKLLVLAGGFGTRLRSVVEDVPKALAPIGNVPFLHMQIEHWINQGLTSFVFLLHHQADLIINFLNDEQHGFLEHCEVRWLVEPAPLGTGGAVAYAVQQLRLSGSFLVTNADTWLGTGAQDVLQATAPAMAVVRVADAGRYGRVILDVHGNVTEFHEKSNSADAGWINAGLCLLDAQLFQDWNQQPFSLEQVCFPALAASGALKGVALNTDFIDIGIPADYRKFCDRAMRNMHNRPERA